MPENASLARLSIRFQSDGALLPEGVSGLRLRVEELRLHERGGAWRSFPSSSGVFDLAAGSDVLRTVLNTQVPPVTYDSLAVIFGGLYVEYGPNAGGPLRAASAPQAVRAVTLEADTDPSLRLDLVLNPAASLVRDPDCSWHFLPFVTVVPRD